MSKDRVPQSLAPFRSVGKPHLPSRRCIPASQAVGKSKQPGYLEQRLKGYTDTIDFPAEPILLDPSIARPYTIDVIHLIKHYLINMYCVQLILFIIKLFCMGVVLASLIVLYLTNASPSTDLLILVTVCGGAVLCSTLLTIFVYYYVGVINAKRREQLPCRFIVFMVCNYLLSLGFAACFGYLLLRLWVYEDLSLNAAYASLIKYGLTGAVGLFYVLGVTILVFLSGLVLYVCKILLFLLVFMYKVFTLKLFASKAERPRPKVMPSPLRVPVGRGEAYNCEGVDVGPGEEVNAMDFGTKNDEMAKQQDHDADPNTQNELLGSAEKEARESADARLVHKMAGSHSAIPMKSRPLKGIVKDFKSSMRIKLCILCQKYFEPQTRVVGLTSPLARFLILHL